MATPFYIPTNYDPLALWMYFLSLNYAPASGFNANLMRMFILPQLHILTSICYFLVLLVVEYKVAGLCFIGMGPQPSPLTGGAVSWRLRTKALTHSAPRSVACWQPLANGTASFPWDGPQPMSVCGWGRRHASLPNLEGLPSSGAPTEVSAITRSQLSITLWPIWLPCLQYLRPKGLD